MTGVILCIDEEPAALSLRQRVLERAGYAVLVAMNAREALAVFRRNDVDLVLLEPMMAPSDSAELIRRMRQLRPEVPIVMYSSAFSCADQAGRLADRFLSKLVPVDEMLEMIGNLISRKARRTAAGISAGARAAASQRNFRPLMLRPAAG